MAWTATLQSIKGDKNSNVVIRYLLTSDGSAGGHSVYEKEMRGRSLQRIDTTPSTGGVAPSVDYTIAIKIGSTTGPTYHTTAARTAATIQSYDVPSNAGANLLVTGPVYFSYGDLGDSGDQVTVDYVFA